MTTQLDILPFMNANNLSYRCIWYYIRGDDDKKMPIYEKNNISLEEALNSRWWSKTKPELEKIKTIATHKNITDDEYKNLIPSYSLYLKHTEDLYVVDVDVYGINSMDDFIQQTGITMFANTAWTTGNRKGLHIYVYIKNMIEYTNQQKVFKAFEGDFLRTNNVWIKRNKMVNNNDIQPFEWADIEPIVDVDKMNTETKPSTKKTTKKTEKKPVVVSDGETDVESVSTDATTTTTNINVEEKCNNIRDVVKAILDVNLNYFDDYNEWIQLGFIIFNETNGSEEGADLFVELTALFNTTDPNRSQRTKSAVYAQYHATQPNRKKNGKKGGKLMMGSLYSWLEEENQNSPLIKKKSQSKKKTNLPTDDEVRQTDIYIEYRNEFEKKYFKLNNPVCYCVINNHKKKGRSLTFLNEKDFNLLNKDVKGMPEFLVDGGLCGTEKKFYQLWIEDPDKLKHNTIMFDPSMKEDNDNDEDYTDYNAFVGWINDKGAEPMKEEESDFIKLMKWLLVEDRTFEYFKCWFSHIIQQPTNKTKVAPVLFSKTHGSGKNTLIDGLIAILGRGLCGHVESIDDITKNFNAHLCNKLLVYGDEINANAKKVADKLKAYITRPTANLEKKGHDSIEVDDYTNSIFTSNHENTIKIEEGCRRFLMVRCREEKQTEYSIKSYAEIEDPIKVAQLFSFFKKYTQSPESIKLYGKFVLGQGNVIETEYKKQMLFENRPAYIQMFYKSPRELVETSLSASSLYEVVKEWGKKNYCSTNFTIQEFSKNSKKYIEIYKTRTKSSMKYTFPSKNEFLKNLYKVDEEYYRYINQLDDDFYPTFEAEPEISLY